MSTPAISSSEHVLSSHKVLSYNDQKQRRKHFVDKIVNTGLVQYANPQSTCNTLPLEKVEGQKLSHQHQINMKPGYALEIPRPGLFEQPVLVEGKRQRKLSAKMILKLTEGLRIKIDTEIMNRDSNNEQTVSKMPVLKSESSKLHGNNIVRKAKLHLNQATMNKSKNALAHSLKRKMHREEQLSMQQQRATGISITKSKQPINVKPTLSIHCNSINKYFLHIIVEIYLYLCLEWMFNYVCYFSRFIKSAG